jgi:predicted phage-related endonuclease
VPGAWGFKKIKKEGLPESYLLQLQWQMLCYGVTWGSFAVYWPDGHELLQFDVERDDELCEMLFQRAEEEWSNITMARLRVQEGESPGISFPDKKDPHHTACQTCSGFELCHESKLEKSPDTVNLPELEGSLALYVNLTAQIKHLEKNKAEVKDLIRDELAGKNVGKAVGGRFEVNLREQSRESISPKVKEILDDKQTALYVKQTTFEVMTVKEGKKP